MEAPVGQGADEASTEPEDVALPALPSLDDPGDDEPEESAMLRAVEFVLPERAAQLATEMYAPSRVEPVQDATPPDLPDEVLPWKAIIACVVVSLGAGNDR